MIAHALDESPLVKQGARERPRDAVLTLDCARDTDGLTQSNRRQFGVTHDHMDVLPERDASLLG